ncbi:A disintegrin and metalloproteinase with thrombospondin motifs 20 isoform X4 [Wyeomyia smithii]|uniref:A disintegrin and metalloproteinase with thrombospondin motifs 20 isoform X4 n=1 Tax=Wyeomyia smithii TaxID=174621 RepID=UPI002467D1DC|nr:A disintegrin and metalloproteinase with thrombospondin motifs 20 isoform X4 [Wyeomyia smithii]
MTTRWSSPKCWIYTVVGGVLLIIVTLIVSFVHHGNANQHHVIDNSDNSVVDRLGAFPRKVGEGLPVTPTGMPPGGTGTAHGSTTDDANILRKPLDGSNGTSSFSPTATTLVTGHDTNGIPRLQDSASSEEVLLIKPTKLTQPLHADDLLYDSKTTSADTPGAQLAPKFHWTGLFRNQSSRIWDPHPEYKIEAFGLKMHIKLSQDSSFMPKDIKVTHVWPNETLRKPEDHLDHAGLQGCFYRGRVEGDKKSTVTVSLCGGMRGHIRTSNGSFFIEPVETYSNEDTNIWHTLSRERVSQEILTVDDDVIEPAEKNAGSNCALDTKQEEHDKHLESIELNGNDDDGSPTAANGGHSRRKRSTAHITNNEYTIEVLVAVDKKMQEYHRDTLKSYVLTLMSIVSSIYADASIGNSIKIAVVHILYLHQNLAAHSALDLNGSKGVSASEMLQAFCRIKQASNFHHDTAFLLTREQICRHQMKCDTLGLAELGTMCKRSSCAIVQDNGLSAAFTIAHELGHVLSMPHDDDVRCGPFRGESSTKQNIMSRMLDQNTHPWSWSNCSRHFVTEYLETNHASCMLDKPTTDLIEPSSSQTKLAGEKFTNNQQCELVFGNGSRICSYMPVCKRLWCNNGDELLGCRTQHMPWADGTSCGENQWCQKGECVHVNREALQPQDGGWGQWSPFSECSRSCGGGVQTSTRVCDSPAPENGGKYCIGIRMQYRSCNTHDCPDDTLDFREEQCHELDGNNFEIPGLEKNVKWIPKYGVKADDQCKLYCRVKNSNSYFLLRDKVKDGTSCTHPHESYDMCINGQCRRAGCDYVFDSDAKLDKCGICRGNNDTCGEVNGVFPFSKIHFLKKPYVQKIVRIPRGATNIEIIQRGYKDDGNYLALRDENDDYIFNAPKMTVVTGFKRRLFAGVMLEYNGPDEPIEIVRSDFGHPLKRDLVVEIYSHSKMHPVSENIVEYSFTIPNDRPPVSVTKSTPTFVQHYPSQNSIPNYQWKMSEWSECDQSCSGKRHRTAGCYDIETGKEKPISYCRNSAKPREDYEPCNMECKFEWEATTSECSNSCGEGVKNVQYQCVQRYIKTQQTNPVDPTYCANIRKPNILEKCHGPCLDATWSYSEWDPCSRTCGGGRQNRTARCLSSPDGFRISESFCAEKPKEEIYRRCNVDSCPEWVTGELTPCSVTCGEGQQRYAIYCVLNNVSVNAALCGTRPVAVIVNCTMPPCEKKQEPPAYAYSGEETKPIIAQHDSNYYSALHTGVTYNNVSSSAHPYKWCTSVWSICNAKCNGGIKQRKVQCCYKHNESRIVDDLYCHKEKKPSVQTNCGNFRCPQWNFGQWGECNDDCKRYRQVLCQDHRGTESTECPVNQKPPEVESCCHFRWRITNWKPCKCDGFQRRGVKCYDELTKSESNRCPEPRPTQKKKCTPTPDCRPRYSKSISFTCQDVQRNRQTRRDGEYALNVKDRLVTIYCHNMTSSTPTEYLTLKSGLVENYAIYNNKRASNSQVCAPSSEDFVDESIAYGATHYRKIRLNIQTLQVLVDDHRFTDRSGKPQSFGSAGDCYSITGRCPQGDFSINLENTPFRIRPRTKWETKGQSAVIQFLIPLEAPFQKVRARCGGYCGTCSVSQSSGLFLELV